MWPAQQNGESATAGRPAQQQGVAAPKRGEKTKAKDRDHKASPASWQTRREKREKTSDDGEDR